MNLILGDCLERMKEIPDDSVDLIIADLPYGTTNVSWDTVIPYNLLWESFDRICKKGSTIILFGNGIFTAKTVISMEKWYKYNLVWKKSKCGSPLLAKFRPMMKHEDVILFTKDGGKHKTYNPQKTEGTPYKRSGVKTKTNNHGYGVSVVESNNIGERHPTSILDFPMLWRRQDQIHPTQKPVELMEWLVKSYSNIGDSILDPTMGSGTTGVACINTNRNFIGIEMDEGYFNIATKRINEAQLKKDNELV
jgi:site-specific DNA-methyltransferase (adenine-specific)